MCKNSLDSFFLSFAGTAQASAANNAGTAANNAVTLGFALLTVVVGFVTAIYISDM